MYCSALLRSVFQKPAAGGLRRLAPAVGLTHAANAMRFEGSRRDRGDDHHHNHAPNQAAKKKVQENNDERWLEAELDENINTPEEMYAHARAREQLEKMAKNIGKDQK